MGLQTLITTTLIVLLFLHFYPTRVASFAPTSGSISSWCTQTPYPSQCEHYLNLHQLKTSSFSNNDINAQPSDFLKLVLGSALQASLVANHSASLLGVKCRDAKEKAAWYDCLELYELATQQLNQTMSDPTCTHDDSQTWLSAVLTHFETCKSGFEEVGANGDLLLPLMGYPNITYLISNALAVNIKHGQTHTQTRSTRTQSTLNGFKSGFPRWVRGGDGRLLQTSSAASSADIVVAKDGSGHYLTVTEAVNAAKAMAKKSNGGGRTVIYVKAGEYVGTLQCMLVTHSGKVPRYFP